MRYKIKCLILFKMALIIFMALPFYTQAHESTKKHTHSQYGSQSKRYWIAKQFTNESLKPIIREEIIQQSLRLQNNNKSSFSYRKLKDLNAVWEKESKNDKKPLISSIINNTPSKFLTKYKQASHQIIPEIFIYDKNRVILGQTAIAPYYWHEEKIADEGARDPVVIEKYDREHSVQNFIYSHKISLPIEDNHSKETIGYAIFFVDLDKLSWMPK